ncbi:uncharacterized protein ISCGN_000287 [Ixodes scapularis]
MSTCKQCDAPSVLGDLATSLRCAVDIAQALVTRRSESREVNREAAMTAFTEMSMAHVVTVMLVTAAFFTAYLRATRCVHELSQKEQCIDDSSHKMLTHFRQKSQGKDCERYDYRQCGAAGTAVSSAFLLVGTFLLVRLFGTS